MDEQARSDLNEHINQCEVCAKTKDTAHSRNRSRVHSLHPGREDDKNRLDDEYHTCLRDSEECKQTVLQSAVLMDILQESGNELEANAMQVCVSHFASLYGELLERAELLHAQSIYTATYPTSDPAPRLGGLVKTWQKVEDFGGYMLPRQGYHCRGIPGYQTVHDHHLYTDVRFTSSELERMHTCFRQGRNPGPDDDWDPIDGLPAMVKTNEGFVVPSEIALLCFLKRLAGTDTLCNVATWMGWDSIAAVSKVSSIIAYMIQFVYQFADALFKNNLEWWAPRIEMYNSVILEHVRANGWELPMEYQGVCAFIDGSCLEIARPSDNELADAFYSGYHGKHCMGILAIVSPDGMVMYLADGFSGAVNDNDRVTESGLTDELAELFSDDLLGYCILGDKLFGTTEYIKAILKESVHLHADDLMVRRNINRTLANVRVAVEWNFGNVNGKFPFQGKVRAMKTGTSAIGKLHGCSHFFYNAGVCFRSSGPAPGYFQCHPPTFESWFHSR